MSRKHPKAPLLQADIYDLSPKINDFDKRYTSSHTIKLMDTRDVSFTTKLKLLLWKNYKSQYRKKWCYQHKWCYRYQCGFICQYPYFCKLLFPLVVMVLLGLIASGLLIY